MIVQKMCQDSSNHGKRVTEHRCTAALCSVLTCVDGKLSVLSKQERSRRTA